MANVRFTIDLESPQPSPAPASLPFIKDIAEQPTSAAPTAPSFPAASLAGFPLPKKRQRRPTAPRNAPPAATAKPAVSSDSDRSVQADRQKIAAENEMVLSSMSEDEIAESRKALYDQFGEHLLTRLMNRKTGPSSIVEASPGSATQQSPDFDRCSNTKDTNAPATADAVHFVRRKEQQEIADPDPSSPEFLEALKEKYFPNLATDPSKLEWMKPVTEEELLREYHPSMESLPSAALRFDFRGQLLPPSKSLELPTHLGLHHHGSAPGAAGYTILELAQLSRSAFPAQRCMAMQTLGRIMLRMGRGEFGHLITPGLEESLAQGRVMETLQEAANQEGGHWGVRNYAIEALWHRQLGYSAQKDMENVRGGQ